MEWYPAVFVLNFPLGGHSRSRPDFISEGSCPLVQRDQPFLHQPCSAGLQNGIYIIHFDVIGFSAWRNRSITNLITDFKALAELMLACPLDPSGPGATQWLRRVEPSMNGKRDDDPSWGGSELMGNMGCWFPEAAGPGTMPRPGRKPRTRWRQRSHRRKSTPNWAPDPNGRIQG